jgi:hypothetical protein
MTDGEGLVGLRPLAALVFLFFRLALDLHHKPNLRIRATD